MQLKSGEADKILRAKQRASVGWIVQKAHKNKVPTDLQDPYYKDYEGVEHLKPSIVHRLSNADLYCSALSNIYGDPNFHNLSHWNIIQALARKGVYVAEPTDVALTETVLIQVTPLKISAHLAVIEAMMALYIREVVIAERVVAAVQKVISQEEQDLHTLSPPQDQEEALVLWVDSVAQSLLRCIRLQSPKEQDLPELPRIQDLSDLSDGIGLAALVSFYCPHELCWKDIAVADPPSMADSLYNVGLVMRFCSESLPYNPCLLTKEDIVYMHSSVKQNILAFVAELFFLLELEPVSCVEVHLNKKMKYSQVSSDYGKLKASNHGIRRQLSLTERDRPRKERIPVHDGMKPAGAPSVPSVRRSHSMNLNEVDKPRLDSRSENAPSSYNSDYGGKDSSVSDGADGDFVVQRSKGIATLNDMFQTGSPRPHEESVNKSINRDDDQGERRLSRHGSFHGSSQDLNSPKVPAGVPTRWDERPRGRSRSRRNSITADESQLTIENFGGSQDNLNYISRNPDKEPFVHMGRKDDSSLTSRETSHGETRRGREQSVERRLDLHRSSFDELDNRVAEKLERDAIERERRDFGGHDREGPKKICHTNGREDFSKRRSSAAEYQDSGSESDISDKAFKATSFAELSKLKEQLPGGINIIYMQNEKDEHSHKGHKSGGEKRMSFATLPNQTTWKQQTVQNHLEDSKAAVEPPEENMEPQVMASDLHDVRLKLEEKRRRIEGEKRKMELMMNKQRQKLGKEAFMQAVVKADIGQDVSNLSKKWLDHEGSQEELKTPDMDTMDYEECHRSLSQAPQKDAPSSSRLRHYNQQAGLDLAGYVQPRIHPDYRRYSLYLEPGTWAGAGGDVPLYVGGRGAGLPPIMPPRRVSLFPEYLSAPYRMNDSLTEIQGDIQRITQQQHQIQSLMQNGMHPQVMPQPSSQFYLHDQGSPVRRMWGQQMGNDTYPSVSPASRRAQWGPVRPMMPQNDYMMGQGQPNYYSQYQMGQVLPVPPSSHGFMLHAGQPQSLPTSQLGLYQNTQGYYPGTPENQFRTMTQQPNYMAGGSRAPFRLHGDNSEGDESMGSPSLRSSAQSSPSRQFSHRQQKSPSPGHLSVSHAPVAAPPPDDMEPQSVSFIESEENTPSQQNSSDLSSRLKKMAISSGSRTYRIPHEPGSPTRPSIGTKTFKVPTKKGVNVDDQDSEALEIPQPSLSHRSISPLYQDQNEEEDSSLKAEPLLEGASSDKGFYISLDDGTTRKKPKPPLKPKKPVTRKSSTPVTPLSTPSKEELPAIADTTFSCKPLLDWNSNRPEDSMFPVHRLSSMSPASSSLLSSPLSPSGDLSSLHSTPQNSAFGGDKKCSSFDKRSSMSSEGKVDVSLSSDRDKVSECSTLVIDDDLNSTNTTTLSDMERKKEKLMMMSLKRKQKQEEKKHKKEVEAELKREEEKSKDDMKQRKKEEDRLRREAILERHKIKKAMEEAEKEGRTYHPPPGFKLSTPPAPSSSKSSVKLRSRGTPGGQKPRPKTVHEGSLDGRSSVANSISNLSRKGSSSNIPGDEHGISGSLQRTGRWGSSQSLMRTAGSRASYSNLSADPEPSSHTLDRSHTGKQRPTSVYGSSSLRRESSRGSLYGSRGGDFNYKDDDPFRVHTTRRPSLAVDNTPGRSSYGYRPYRSTSAPRRIQSTGNLSGQSEHDSLWYHMSEDSGLGRATPPRRAPSPSMGRQLPSPSGPGSLPPGLISKRRAATFDDAASDISGTSSNIEYCGPRLFKQPRAKSNRTIILNAVEYCVFPGIVNQTAKRRVLEEIARSEAKHFLILFRDSGCQFRALYSFNPDTEEVYKLYGTGPKQVNDRMYDKFFKYNSGGKCFSPIHTKHITVTIDAFTIHNSLWQGKKINLPSKKDMTLVI